MLWWEQLHISERTDIPWRHWCPSGTSGKWETMTGLKSLTTQIRRVRDGAIYQEYWDRRDYITLCQAAPIWPSYSLYCSFEQISRWWHCELRGYWGYSIKRWCNGLWRSNHIKNQMVYGTTPCWIRTCGWRAWSIWRHISLGIIIWTQNIYYLRILLTYACRRIVE